MPNYRRYRIPGECYFFTVNLLQRHGNDLLVKEIHCLRDAVRHVRRLRPFNIDAWVILPDHMHCIWTLPPDDDYAGRWQAIKDIFLCNLPHTDRRSKVRVRKGERGIWQRRFWEYAIRDDRDYSAQMDFIHFKPVKHGYVKQVADWPHSTFMHFPEKAIIKIVRHHDNKLIKTVAVESDGFFLAEGLSAGKYILHLTDVENPPPPLNIDIPAGSDWVSNIQWQWR